MTASPREPLGEPDVEAALARSPGWSRAGDGGLRLRRVFPSPAAAFGFATAVAMLAERRDHHPELRWAHREVELRLVTRDAGGAVTALDVELMRAIAALP